MPEPDLNQSDILRGNEEDIWGHGDICFALND
jgi:hypothetical protein